MKLLNFTIIQLTICLVAGILAAHYFVLNFYVFLYLSIGLTVCIGFYAFLIRHKINHSALFTILTYLCIICIGITTYNLQNDKLRPRHYTHHNFNNSVSNITFQIKERLKPDLYNDKYIVSIKTVNDKKTIGLLLINIKRDSIIKPYNVDDLFYTSTTLKTIQKPLNPYQFDYNKYLEFQQVYHQLYLNSTNILQLSNSKHTIYGHADLLRTKINSKLIEAGFKDDALSIMNALLLGQRQTIDKTIYSNYVNSGTVHILAVSGLHIGIILIILNYLFKPLLYLKYGYYIRPFILIIIMCSFAIIAGLKPSVTRAVLMFSIITIARHFERGTNIYNTLVISAFLILLFKPNFLFSVGFQMSYLAVLGIVSIQPKIYNLWRPKYKLTNKIWQIFTVTLAAQAGVVPISLFYFHQFPGLFFISNLVVIPFLGFILGLGMIIIALALLNITHHYIVVIYSFIIDCLNNFIAWVAQFESFLLRDISFTISQVIVSYLIITALVQVYKYRNFKWTTISLILIIGLQSICFFNHYKTQNNAFIIFNKSRYTILGQKQNRTLNINHNLDSIQYNNNQAITYYKVGESITIINNDSLQNLYQYNKKTILVIDSLAVYKGITFQPDYILLRNSPRLNLNRASDSLKPKYIIADASNYKSYVKRWKETCRHKKIPFHQTNEKGAFILK
ncbi:MULTISPECIES: ComEC/Rec2 family competence protein [Winogradskyella]|uniref:ComEC/Rec2 family competence protein n=1 Tax=Winogradskyella TaxID=286104 RepID=UPI0015CA18BF|nr:MULTISPECIES: ComEC/Rec2 family competence protein [Winogradskyella]QXP77650.1 ComEC/Rec2 family competence protein [Winogradskyella sp. HaHa_3_26]